MYLDPFFDIKLSKYNVAVEKQENITKNSFLENKGNQKPQNSQRQEFVDDEDDQYVEEALNPAEYLKNLNLEG